MILHADMDAFYASVEQRDDPALRGRPVIVGGTSGRGVVSAASYEARRYGVHSAMPTAHARQRCPHAVFLRGDMEKYRSESRRIFEIFGRFSPAVEGLSLDEAFLDLSGTERLLGPPARVALDLRHAVRDETGLTVSCGVAPVKMVAKIASDLCKPDGLRIVAPEAVADFLAPLPVSRIWGVGPAAQRELAARGITRMGELREWPEVRLRSALGAWAVRAARLARGEDARSVEPGRAARSYGEENTFARDIRDLAALRGPLRAHAEAVARRLRRDRVRARRVVLKLKLARPLGGGRYPLLTRSHTLASATDDGGVLARTAQRLLDSAPLEDAVRLLGVSASGIEHPGREQLDLFAPEPSEAAGARPALNRVLDDVRDRFGPRALSRGPAEVARAGLSEQIKPGEDPP